MKYLRTISAILLALVIGFVGLRLLYSDLGPGETITQRLYITEAVYFTAGLAIGLTSPNKWWLAGLAAWGGVLLAVASLFNPVRDTWLTLIFLIASLLPSFVGGYTGSFIGKRHLWQRLWRKKQH